MSMTMMSELDQILAGGGKTAKFETIGTTYSGTVLSAELRQATNFDTGKPEFWDDGKPKMQVVVSIQTNERNDAEDDGARSVYIKAWGDQKRALQAAAKAAGGSPAPGDTFTVRYIADGEKPARGFAPKVYEYKIVKGNSVDAALSDQWATPAQAAVQQVQAQPVQQAPTQAAQPVQQVPASGGASTEQIAKAIDLGLTDEQIAQAIGATAQDIQLVRLQRASTGAGF